MFVLCLFRDSEKLSVRHVSPQPREPEDDGVSAKHSCSEAVSPPWRSAHTSSHQRPFLRKPVSKGSALVKKPTPQTTGSSNV